MRRWTYVIGVLVATVVVAFGLIAAGGWLPRGPVAQPAPTDPGPPPPPKAEANFGGRVLEPHIIDGVPTYDLVLKKVLWDTGGGAWKEAYTVNGAVPGPELRVKEGQLTRFRVKNELDEPSSIHWHGIILPPEQDGVAHLTQDPIEPGESFTYEFAPGPAGTKMYHSHFNGAQQTHNGLYGAIIVEPKDPSHPTHPSQYDRDFTLIIGDAGLGLVMNGKGFPYNEPMRVREGERFLLRMINLGAGNHPMHLHGHDYHVVAKDGNPIAQPMEFNTVDIAPGETYDLKWRANNPGSWLFHCHILPHAEGPQGMFGLTSMFEYEGFEPGPEAPKRHLAPHEKRLPGVPGQYHGH